MATEAVLIEAVAHRSLATEKARSPDLTQSMWIVGESRKGAFWGAKMLDEHKLLV